MGKRWEIVLAGSGGQGLIVAGVTLALAAAIYDNKNAVQTQTYGIQSRGGDSQAEVIIWDQEIIYPKTVVPDIVLALTEDAYAKYLKRLTESNSVIIFDQDNVNRMEGRTSQIGLPLTSMARNLGNPLTLNSIALGIIVKKSQAVSVPAMEKAFVDKLDPKVLKLNLRAFHAGMALIN